MAGKPVVFLGPTLPAAQAEAILDALYLPPAEQGSVVRTVRDFSPSAIVLIDGAFGKVPAVRHKEILWALACGIPVLGAASMGAIRAAELARCARLSADVAGKAAEMLNAYLAGQIFTATPLDDTSKTCGLCHSPSTAVETVASGMSCTTCHPGQTAPHYGTIP